MSGLFILRLGALAAIMLMLAPTIKAWRDTPEQREDSRRFERQAAAAEDVTGSEEDDPEEATPPPRQRSRQPQQRTARRREPIRYRDPVRGVRQLSDREARRMEEDARRDAEISETKNMQPPEHWRWKYESQRNVICEPLWDEPWRTVCHTNFEHPAGMERPRAPVRQPRQRYVEGPPINGPDGRLHRTRMRVPDEDEGGGCPNQGGCPYEGN
jgi:hypothetical protein